jgi:hypothetical protein
VISFRIADTDLILQLQEVLLPNAADIHQLLDLFAEDSQLNVYRGELEVRPPGAPTTGSDSRVLATSQEFWASAGTMDGCAV